MVVISGRMSLWLGAVHGHIRMPLCLVTKKVLCSSRGFFAPGEESRLLLCSNPGGGSDIAFGSKSLAVASALGRLFKR